MLLAGFKVFFENYEKIVFSGNPEPNAAKSFITEFKNSGMYFWNRIRINDLEDNQKIEIRKIKEEIDKIFRFQVFFFANC